ncbi:phosphodiester glycosidase family protein [Streptomyces sp. TRM 70351]|uniref:phosphodiester glycosidase family protein n=1 Tax=Streptomyces sp. TRM 70351 TaxID=3116552 RepID=UPI002E7B3E10|nr:phosphodiester glycosidase family protein [Streptomyces sp. TRM 70351]MEE1926822.1 phosphodiester glycosidase family protein [Streptomyces sp. TRM 70351]
MTKLPGSRWATVPGALAVALLATSCAAAPAPSTAPAGVARSAGPVPAVAEELPLGPDTLEESRTVRDVAPGVTHTTIERGHTPSGAPWTVTAGFGTTEAEVRELEQRVRAAGYTPRRDAAAGPDPAGDARRPLGWMVRVGRYADEAAANRTRQALRAAGVGAKVQSVPTDGHPTSGPWSLDVLVVDPEEFDGRIAAELAQGEVPGRERVSSIARRTGALAAVNGGYFVLGSRTEPGPWVAGTEGDLAGISVVDGELVSEAVGDRPALVLPSGSGEGAAVRRLRTRLSVRTAGGAERQVTGLNRQAGLIANCGGVGDATPMRTPAHDYTCGNANELVALTAAFGGTAPSGTGYQAVLDGGGRVTAVREGRGGAVPSSGTLLQGTGTSADWLRTHAVPGAVLRVGRTVLDAETGRALPPAAGTSVVNGGPLLLRDGEVALDPVRDGWSPRDVLGADRAAFYNDWYLRRNPRTAAGVTADGKVILLTADGHVPGRGVGLTITETAGVMRALGAVDALNLDGGGSTTMVVDGALVSRPSDAAGERPDGDAVVLVPRP